MTDGDRESDNIGDEKNDRIEDMLKEYNSKSQTL